MPPNARGAVAVERLGEGVREGRTTGDGRRGLASLDDRDGRTLGRVELPTRAEARRRYRSMFWFATRVLCPWCWVVVESARAPRNRRCKKAAPCVRVLRHERRFWIQSCLRNIRGGGAFLSRAPQLREPRPETAAS